MKRLATILVFGLISNCVWAQFGIRVGYTQLPYSDAEATVSDRVDAMHVSLNYWHRLENLRIEFFPEIRYQHPFTSNLIDVVQDQSQLLGIAIPVQFYPFDFVSDCSCPTFSKQSRTFQKGFFLLASAGYFFDISEFNDKSAGTELGIGAGFDIGINDLITLSPQVQYSRILRSDVSPLLDRNWHFGVRASFRPDYRRGF